MGKKDGKKKDEDSGSAPPTLLGLQSMTGSADIGSADFDGLPDHMGSAEFDALHDHMGSADFDSLFDHMEGDKQKKGKKGEKKDDEKKKGGKKKGEDSGSAPPTLLGLQSMTGSADIGSADFDGLLDHMGSAEFDALH